MMLRKNLVVVSLFFLTTTAFANVPSSRAASVSAALEAIVARSVKDYGAIGDGKTNDTAAIQAAVKAGAGLVYFPKGNYRITRTIVVDLNLLGKTSLVGTGGACVIMAGAGPAAWHQIVLVLRRLPVLVLLLEWKQDEHSLE